MKQCTICKKKFEDRKYLPKENRIWYEAPEFNIYLCNDNFCRIGLNLAQREYWQFEKTAYLTNPFFPEDKQVQWIPFKEYLNNWLISKGQKVM